MSKKNGLYEKTIKRLMDCFLAVCGITLLSPIMCITALLVRIKLGAPVFFVQERPGQNGNVFKLYKFRTMKDLRDSDGVLLPDEVRLTSFGRKLRSSSLDELPELMNIIKGDMAIVGPRPLLVKYLERYTERQKRRHEVRPGITGLAQVSGRNSLSWEDTFEKDIEYVDNISFALDLRIIMRTVGVVLKREGIDSGTSSTKEEFMGYDD